MSNATQIAASILAADFSRLGEQVREAEQGGAGLIHIDVMDGRFVPNLTMGAVIVEAARRSTQLPLDVHLMMVEPDHLLADFATAGANRITVPPQASPVPVIPLESDEPNHTFYRSVFAPLVTPKAVHEHESANRSIVVNALDTLAARAAAMRWPISRR